MELLFPNSQRKTIFFTGKGGVGKTTISCIISVFLAGNGYRTLLVTTDPASHLSEVFGQDIDSEVKEIEENLFAVRIDSKKAAEEYSKKILGDAQERYSEDVLKVISEQLASPCTEEMAAFNKFTDYIQDQSYDVTIFDTAPTGHTLRLLMLPMEWSSQLELSALATVEGNVSSESAERYRNVIDIMGDKEKTVFCFVLYPEYTPIMEAYRAAKELEGVNVKTSLVVANNILPEDHCTNAFFRKRREMQEKYLTMTRKKFGVPVLKMPLLDEEIKGIEGLRNASKILFGGI